MSLAVCFSCQLCSNKSWEELKRGDLQPDYEHHGGGLLILETKTLPEKKKKEKKAVADGSFLSKSETYQAVS